MVNLCATPNVASKWKCSRETSTFVSHVLIHPWELSTSLAHTRNSTPTYFSRIIPEAAFFQDICQCHIQMTQYPKSVTAHPEQPIVTPKKNIYVIIVPPEKELFLSIYTPVLKSIYANYCPSNSFPTPIYHFFPICRTVTLFFSCTLLYAMVAAHLEVLIY